VALGVNIMVKLYSQLAAWRRREAAVSEMATMKWRSASAENGGQPSINRLWRNNGYCRLFLCGLEGGWLK